MNRVDMLREHVSKLIDQIADDAERHCASFHLFGVSLSCAMIAAKRGLDAELAAIAGILHDLFEYENYQKLDHLPDRQDHGHRNASHARAVLERLGITTDWETEMICVGIANHGYKDQIHTPFDEVVKDGDVLQKQLWNVRYPVHPIHKERYARLIKEFGLTIPES